MRKNEQGSAIFILILGIVSVILLIWLGMSSYGTWADQSRQNVTITVKHKERAWNQDQNEEQYLIFSKEGEVFQNTDDWYFQKYDSSDIYGQLDINKKYSCDVFGYREPRWSRYRNILSCEEQK